MPDLYPLIALVIVVSLLVRTTPRNWVTARELKAPVLQPVLQRWSARVQLAAQPLLAVGLVLALLPLGNLPEVVGTAAVVLVGVVLLALLTAAAAILASGQRR